KPASPELAANKAAARDDVLARVQSVADENGYFRAARSDRSLIGAVPITQPVIVPHLTYFAASHEQQAASFLHTQVFTSPSANLPRCCSSSLAAGRPVGLAGALASGALASWAAAAVASNAVEQTTAIILIMNDPPPAYRVDNIAK